MSHVWIFPVTEFFRLFQYYKPNLFLTKTGVILDAFFVLKVTCTVKSFFCFGHYSTGLASSDITLLFRA